MLVGGSAPRPGRFTPWKDPLPIVEEAVYGRARNISPKRDSNHESSGPQRSLYTDCHVVSVAYINPVRRVCLLQAVNLANVNLCTHESYITSMVPSTTKTEGEVITVLKVADLFH